MMDVRARRALPVLLCAALLVTCDHHRKVDSADDEAVAAKGQDAGGVDCGSAGCPAGTECIDGFCQEAREVAAPLCRTDGQCQYGWACQEGACVQVQEEGPLLNNEILGMLGYLGSAGSGDGSGFGELGSDADAWSGIGDSLVGDGTLWEGFGMGGLDLSNPGTGGGGTGEGIGGLGKIGSGGGGSLGFGAGLPGQPVPCTQDVDCLTGETCWEYQCRPQEGAALGESCQGDADCAPLLTCLAGVCVRRMAVGHRCNYEMDCGYQEVCIMGACADHLQQMGDPCWSSSDCDMFQAMMACMGSKCVAVPMEGGQGAGEPCYTDSDCVEGLLCGYAGCTPNLAGEGELCQEDLHCAEPFLCVYGACMVDARIDGAVCKRDEDCQSAFCLAGTCRDGLLPDGSPCWQGSDCDSGLCILDVCSSSAVEQGGKCHDDLDCGPTLACIAGKCQGSQSSQGGACAMDADCVWGLHCGKKGKCK